MVMQALYDHASVAVTNANGSTCRPVHIFWNKCLVAAAISHCYVVAETSLHVGVLLACSQLHLWTALLL